MKIQSEGRQFFSLMFHLAEREGPSVALPPSLENPNKTGFSAQVAIHSPVL